MGSSNFFFVVLENFVIGSQMTSKRGKNKKVTYEAIAEFVSDVLTVVAKILEVALLKS